MGYIKKQLAMEKWKVLISTTLIQSIVCGIIESYGALFVPIMKNIFAKDNMKAAKAALIGSLGSGFLMGFSPFSSWLSRKWGVLLSAIFGAVIIFFATFCASFANTFILLALTYGVSLGIGCSLLFINNNVIISQHFGENSTIAFGLLGFGNGIMNSIMPHIIAFAVERIGLFGTIRTICLILSPIIFLPFYWKERNTDFNGSFCLKVNKPYIRKPGTLVKEIFYSGDNKSNFVKKMLKSENYLSKVENKSNKKYSVKLNAPEILSEEVFNCNVCTLNYVSDIKNQSNLIDNSFSENGPTYSSYNTLDLTFTTGSENKPLLGLFKDYFEPLRNKGFLNLCLSMIISTLGYQVANVHMVNYANDLSISGNPQILLTCLGGASAIGPLVNPFLVSKFEEHISKFRIFQIFILGYGMSVMFLPVARAYYSLVILCLIIGYFDGSFTTLVGPLIIDLIGLERSGDAIGLYYGFIAFSVTIAAPLAGFIYTEAQSYTLPFFIAGTVFLTGGFMLSFTHKSVKYKKVTS